MTPEAGTSRSWTSERARVAALARHKSPDDPELADARRELRAIRLEDHVRRVLEAAPPLTDAQRIRLAALLMGSATAATSPPGGEREVDEPA